MRTLSAVLLLLISACTSADVEATSTITTGITTTTPASTTTAPASTTTTQPPVECPSAPYELEYLPVGFGEDTLDFENLEPDVWTSVGGTRTTFWGRNDGTVAIALIRGTLPAVDWPGVRGEADVDGTPAVVGSHPDDTWVAGWVEEPRQRCDLYSMVFYPPWNPADVEQVLDGMNRVAG